MTTDHGQLTIALVFDTDLGYSMQLHEGIREFAVRQGNWTVLPLAGAQDGVIADLVAEGRLSGVIGPFLSDRWIEDLLRRVPLVNVSGASRLATVPSVVPDDRLAGRLAAEHLLANGCRTLGVVSPDGTQGGRDRQEGFGEKARAAGLDVSLPPRSTGYTPTACWDDWLASLAAPAGVFGVNDFVARQIVQRCRRLRRRVPEEIAVVGAGDSPLDGILAGMGLTSVVLQGRQAGWQAANRMLQCLQGETLAGVIDRVPPERVAVRQSSAQPHTRDPLVSRALARMRLQASGPLRMAALARTVGASRRTIETRFRAVLGRSPAQALREMRMDLARQLLARSGLTVAAIGERCGYPECHHFAARFKAHHGMAPGAWRRRTAAGAAGG